MLHLTTPDNIRKNVRPISKNIENNRIEPYIDEVEQRIIKPRIGSELFIDLIDWMNTDDKSSFPDEYEILMNGGVYDYITCKQSEKKVFKGLQSAINYYVYAKIIKNNDINISRLGIVNKEDDYSSRVDLNIRLASEKDALQVADGYISECIDYLNVTKNITKFKRAGKQNNRLRVSVIKFE